MRRQPCFQDILACDIPVLRINSSLRSSQRLVGEYSRLLVATSAQQSRQEFCRILHLGGQLRNISCRLHSAKVPP